MKLLIFLSALVVAITAQRLATDYRQPENYAPIPYSFSYVADGDDGGSSSHNEQGDGAGRVTGSYTVTSDEGYTRVVDYVADEGGFRANIRTNEPGTANQNPADVVIESTADQAPAPVVRPTLINRNPVPIAPVAPIAPISPIGGRGPGVRYVLVPITDPRAAGYY